MATEPTFYLTDRFLKPNGFEIVATGPEVVEMVLAIESDLWTVELITDWMRAHVQPLV